MGEEGRERGKGVYCRSGELSLRIIRTASRMTGRFGRTLGRMSWFDVVCGVWCVWHVV